MKETDTDKKNKFIDVVLTDNPTDEISGFGIAGLNTITEEDVDNFISAMFVTKVGPKTTFVQVALINGFTIEETSSCVDPVNYDEQVGIQICMEKIRNKVWELLGFLLQTALYGFNQNKVGEAV